MLIHFPCGLGITWILQTINVWLDNTLIITVLFSLLQIVSVWLKDTCTVTFTVSVWLKMYCLSQSVFVWLEDTLFITKYLYGELYLL